MKEPNEIIEIEEVESNDVNLYRDKGQSMEEVSKHTPDNSRNTCS